MDGKLLFRAILKFLSGLLIFCALLFIPAGTLAYRKAWLMTGLLFVPMFVAGLVMVFKSPDLLEKRLNTREEQSEQKTVIMLSGLMFITSFVLAGLNYRFGWIILPDWISFAAAIVFLAGYVLYAEVLRENRYLSRTVEVQEGQKVVDTGLYGIVRHPMYASTLLLFLSMPLILGSLISFIVMLAYLPIIDRRMRNEEKVLEEGLEGYREYKERVRYRIIPFIW